MNSYTVGILNLVWHGDESLLVWIELLSACWLIFWGTLKVHKEALRRGDLCLITPYSPNAGFSVGVAMGRSRFIYCLADYAIVVASEAKTGGTWTDVTETIKNKWVPVFVLEHEQMPEGNSTPTKGRAGVPTSIQRAAYKVTYG